MEEEAFTPWITSCVKHFKVWVGQKFKTRLASSWDICQFVIEEIHASEELLFWLTTFHPHSRNLLEHITSIAIRNNTNNPLIVYHVKITMFIMLRLLCLYVVSYNSSGVSTFTFAGVAVNIVPHHGGCWLWPCSELWLHSGERGGDRERER